MKRLALLLLFVISASAFAVDFNEIIRNPEKFQNKRVTLVAMADVGGDRFYLYRPPKPRLSGDDRRVIYGLLRAEEPVYDYFNNKWVKVTGTINTDYRGLVSENACSLDIRRVRLAGKVEKPKSSYGGASCLEIKFSQLLKNPKSYEHKCVCVTGFAHVRGDAFAIYESDKAAVGRSYPTGERYPDYEKGIFVSPVSDTADYDRYNKRWIKIRGVVDVKQRGFADYPCGIIGERVEPTSPVHG